MIKSIIHALLETKPSVMTQSGDGYYRSDSNPRNVQDERDFDSIEYFISVNGKMDNASIDVIKSIKL